MATVLQFGNKKSNYVILPVIMQLALYLENARGVPDYPSVFKWAEKSVAHILTV